MNTNRQRLDYNDTDIHIVARAQRELFKSAFASDYNMQSFIRAYMNSKFCQNVMDAEYSVHQNMDANVNLSYVLQETGRLPKGENEFISRFYELAGYLYRCLFFETDLSSRELYKKLPLDGITPYILALQDKEYKEMVEVILEREFCEK